MQKKIVWVIELNEPHYQFLKEDQPGDPIPTNDIYDCIISGLFFDNKKIAKQWIKQNKFLGYDVIGPLRVVLTAHT